MKILFHDSHMRIVCWSVMWDVIGYFQVGQQEEVMFARADGGRGSAPPGGEPGSNGRIPLHISSQLPGRRGDGRSAPNRAAHSR